MLRYFYEPDLRHREIDLTSVRFKQDGATARTARGSLNILTEMFSHHATSHGGYVRWPARLPMCLSSVRYISQK
jgi:hypothetical protein